MFHRHNVPYLFYELPLQITPGMQIESKHSSTDRHIVFFQKKKNMYLYTYIICFLSAVEILAIYLTI